MRRRGESWELRVYLGRDPISGKPQYRSRSFRGTKRQAEEELSRLCTHALDSTSDPTASRQTFGELVEQWFTSWSPEWSPATASITRGIIDTKLTGLGRGRLDRITPASLDTFYAALRERGGRGGTLLAQASVRRIHAVVSSALEQGVRWGWLQTNPAQRAWKGKGKGRNQSAEVTVPSPADVVALLDAAWASGEWNLAALLELEVHTGLRRAELLALHWADVDAERRTLRVAAAMVGGPAGLVEKAATKTGNHRTVVLSSEAVAVLVAQHERCVDRAGGEPSSLGAGAHVFSTAADGSRPWRPSSVSRSLRLLGERAGRRLSGSKSCVASTRRCSSPAGSTSRPRASAWATSDGGAPELRTLEPCRARACGRPRGGDARRSAPADDACAEGGRSPMRASRVGPPASAPQRSA